MAGPVFQPGTPILPIIELDYEVLCWGVVCHRGGMSGGHYTQGDQGAAGLTRIKQNVPQGQSQPIWQVMFQQTEQVKDAKLQHFLVPLLLKPWSSWSWNL